MIRMNSWQSDLQRVRREETKKGGQRNKSRILRLIVVMRDVDDKTSHRKRLTNFGQVADNHSRPDEYRIELVQSREEGCECWIIQFGADNEGVVPFELEKSDVRGDLWTMAYELEER